MWRSNKTKENLFMALGACNELIVFDTETTGLSAEKDRVIQISGIKFCIGEDNSLTEIERFDRYINPERTLSPKIIEITGITDEILENEKTEEEIFPEIFKFFEDAQIICGHNSSFDIRFMEAMYKRNNQMFDADFVLDTLEMARDIIEKGETENHKLGTLAALYGIDDGITFHNSMDDVVATSRLLRVFMNEYEKREIPTKPVKVAKVFNVRYWSGFKGHARLYINTNLGGFFYDIWNKAWDKKPDNPYGLDEIDMEQLKKDALKLTNSKTEAEFAKYRG